LGGIFVLTADHGNAEDMAKRDKSGKPLRDKDGKVQTLTSHTLNPVSSVETMLAENHSGTLGALLIATIRLQVPIAIGGPGLAPGVRFRTDLANAGLANVAATVMNLHGFEAPDHYEPTLIEVVDK
jgi:2,3-bisphosphoglycerate-independent phosphoglycerate mutase